MAAFKNKFSWSFSRYKIFNECKRKYYFNHYGFWNGWREDADEKTKKIYILKNLTSRHMLAGSVVHETIELIIANYGLGAIMHFEQAEGLMIQKLKKAFLESKNEDWKKKVKGHCNLAEHYFNYNISDEKWIEFRDKASNNLNGFYEIDENSIIKNSNSNKWLTIDKLDSFDYNGTTIFASPDFAFNENDKTIIYDWKTGNPSTDDETQLLIYALYTNQKWDIEYSKMELSDVYLNIGASVYAEDIEEKIPVVEDLIKDSIEQMKGSLVDIDNNVAKESDFPMTNDLNKCKWCDFREICHQNDYKKL